MFVSLVKLILVDVQDFSFGILHMFLALVVVFRFEVNTLVQDGEGSCSKGLSIVGQLVYTGLTHNTIILLFIYSRIILILASAKWFRILALQLRQLLAALSECFMTLRVFHSLSICSFFDLLYNQSAGPVL